jgi:hypothetical protein
MERPKPVPLDELAQEIPDAQGDDADAYRKVFVEHGKALYQTKRVPFPTVAVWRAPWSGTWAPKAPAARAQARNIRRRLKKMLADESAWASQGLVLAIEADALELKRNQHPRPCPWCSGR